VITYQDFLKTYKNGLPTAAGVEAVVNDHKASDEYKYAIIADEYDHQKNSTIMAFQKTIKTITGADVLDPFAANNKLPCNLFNKLNTQRNQFSLGNGVSFKNQKLKDRFGADFDTQLQDLGYFALIHGVSFAFWNMKSIDVFKLTEFAPMYDETNGRLMAGVRFWQITDKHPLNMWLYTIDGMMRFVKDDSGKQSTAVDTGFAPFITKTVKSKADGERVTGGENYPGFPIIPLYGSRLRQSTIVGMRNGIDSYDLVRSGLANDMDDVAAIYWIIKNAGGMDEFDMGRFLNRLKSKHIVAAGNGAQTEGGESNDPEITPYTQDIPYEARTVYCEALRHSIYEDFSAFDVTQLSASAKTATEIKAAYDPMRKVASDFQKQIIVFTQNLGALQGIDKMECIPIFKEDTITNDLEQVQTLALASTWIDQEQIIKRLPPSVVDVDEQEDLIKRLRNADVERYRALEEEQAAQEQMQTPQQEQKEQPTDQVE
jgi:hypothetical protein